jgi:enoyl-CoA hydratase/carnithine racemase
MALSAASAEPLPGRAGSAGPAASPQGCTARLIDGVLHLHLDTPRSSVNILTPAVAQKLGDEVEAGLARKPRAIVVRSDKPGSFLNGAALLSAVASRTPERALARAGDFRRAYQLIAAAPVPTIAVVTGNCFGCGCELTLTCDYRLASDSFDTQFYMTELKDYALIPAFGSTQRFSPLVGLEAAAELLIFGARLDAGQACRMGLVDRVLRRDHIDEDLGVFLAALEALRWPKAARAPWRGPRVLPWTGGRAAARRAQERVESRIRTLPEPEQPLARECAGLIALPFAEGYQAEQGYAAETSAFLTSISTDESARAMGFFFIRQSAKVHSLGTSEYRRPPRMRVELALRGPAARFGDLLRARPLAGVEYLPVPDGAEPLPAAAAASQPAPMTVVFAGTGGAAVPSRPGALHCTVVVASGSGEPSGLLGVTGRSPGALVYVPVMDDELRAAELVLPPGQQDKEDQPDDEARARIVALFQFLEHCGLAPVITRARERFLTDDVLEAFERPVQEALAAGISREDLQAALSRFGFGRVPAPLASPAGGSAARPPDRDGGGGPEADEVVTRIVLGLGLLALCALDDGIVDHPSQVDLLVHLVTGFPVRKGGLLRYLVRDGEERFRQELSAAVPDEDRAETLALAGRVLARRRAFYG